jgi:hypothetical protein
MRKDEKARYRKMQDRLNTWVDQIENRVNEIDKKFKRELRRISEKRIIEDDSHIMKRDRSKEIITRKLEYQPLRYTPAKSEENRS